MGKKGAPVKRQKRKAPLPEKQDDDSALPVAVVEADDTELPEVLLKALKKICVCTVCGPGDRFSARTHASRSGHPWRSMTPEEKAEEIQWWHEIQEDGEVARMQILAAKRERSRKGTRADMDSQAVVPQRGWDWVFDFGKQTKKTLRTVYGTDKSYLGWCVSQPGFFETGSKVFLKRALEETGIMEELHKIGVAQATEEALKVVADELSGKMSSQHRETRKLHAVRLDKARALLGSSTKAAEDGGCTEAIVPATGGSKKERKPRKHGGSRGKKMLQHCWNCGSPDHKIRSCPTRPEELRIVQIEQKCRGLILKEFKREAKLVTHLKYVQLVQRSRAYEERALQRSLVEEQRSQIELLRATPFEFCSLCIEDRLLRNLKNTPCVHPDCKTTYEEKGVLGDLKFSKNPKDRDASMANVWYRCDTCRRKTSVLTGSLLFPPGGHGMKSVTLGVCCMWNCVEGASVTYTCKQLKLKKYVVRHYYDLARRIMAFDAIRREQAIVFGCLPDGATCDVEADEASFFSWREDGPFPNCDRKYFFYVWLGFMQRGTTNLRLFCEQVKTSEEEGRLANLTKEYWRACCSEVFNAESNVVSMTDSCAALTSLPWPTGISE
jgi:hypothetical protein